MMILLYNYVRGLHDIFSNTRRGIETTKILSSRVLSVKTRGVMLLKVLCIPKRNYTKVASHLFVMIILYNHM